MWPLLSQPDMSVTSQEADGQTSRAHLVSERDSQGVPNGTTTDLMSPYKPVEHRLSLRLRTGRGAAQYALRYQHSTLPDRNILAQHNWALQRRKTPPDSRGLCPSRRARDNPQQPTHSPVEGPPLPPP